VPTRDRPLRGRYKGDEEATEEVAEGKDRVPGDVYNGLRAMMMKNMPAGSSSTVQIIAFTPKPRLVKIVALAGRKRAGDDGASGGAATRF